MWAAIKELITPPDAAPLWFDKVPWLWTFLLCNIAVEAFETYLNYRQLKAYRRPDPPAELKDLVPLEEYKKSNVYNTEKLQFRMLSSAAHLCAMFTAFIFGVYPQMWEYAGRCVGYNNEYLQALLFMALQMPLSILDRIPFDLYKDFVIEERYGFNKKSLKLFFTDEVKSLFLAAVIGGPILCAIIWVVNWAGRSFFLYLWLFIVALTFFLMTIYPNVIAPMFNKFETLKDDDLRERIEALASKLNFPLKKLFQMDGSTRSAHSNAYMYGFSWSKRIVLYDTLLELPKEQIVAILGHELGHWKLWHSVTNLVVTFSQLFAMIWVAQVVIWNPALYRNFGFNPAGENMSIVIGLFLLSSIWFPVGAFVGFLMTLLSRTMEFQADKFAVDLGFGDELAGGLLKLFKQNLGDMNPDPWYAWYNFSHPPLIERLRAIRQSRSKDD